MKRSSIRPDDLGVGNYDQSFQPLSLADRAYQRIEAMILSGTLKGGERLNDVRLAEKFSISRGPVRSALARLAEAGLVDLIPYRGVYVRTIDFDDVLEIYDLRAAIERASIKAACRNMTSEILELLNRRVTAMHESFKRGDIEKYFADNLAFHELIHRASGNSRLLEIYERCNREQKLFRHFSLSTIGIAESNKQHRRILRALRASDETAAAREMELHVLSAKKRFEQAIKRIKNA